MGEEKDRLEIVPDPSIVIEKLLKPCMIWLNKTAGILLILGGIWWLLRNLNIIPRAVFWPGIVILIGILCLVEIQLLWKKI